MYHKDRKMYERIARARGLTMASYARMVMERTDSPASSQGNGS